MPPLYLDAGGATMSERPPLSSFFAELQRRKVYRVGALYAVGGWLLVQVATQVFPFFDVPGWAVRLVVILVALGFPVALMLAWVFDLTPQGIVRTDDLETLEAPVQTPQPVTLGTHPKAPRYEFGEFCLDTSKRLLLRHNGQLLPLTPRVFGTLLYLIQHAGRVAGKDELMAAIWPGRVVDENNLSQTISTLRQVLTEGDGRSRCILTVPGRGYRFVCEVREVVGGHEPERATPAAPDSETVSSGLADSSRVRTANLSPGRVMLAMVLIVALLVAVVALRPWRQPAQKVSIPTTQTIAVLPFKPLLADGRDDTLDLGMTDMLIAKLSSTRELIVRPLSSVRRYGELSQDPLAAGRALGVQSVLDGGFQRWGDRIRVTTRLLQVSDGAALWTGSFDEKFTDVFAVQDVISQRVAAALALQLSGDEKKRLAKRYTENIEAYQLYLTGRSHIEKTTRSEIVKGIAFLQRAIELDPNYALAYAAMADAYRRLPISSDVRPGDAFPQAEAAGQKALALDDSIAQTHVALGFIRMWFDWRWVDAEREFKRAIELNPSDAWARTGYAILLTNLTRKDEAILESQRALELDPVSPIVKSIAAWSFSHAGRDDEAIASLGKAFDIDPNFWIAHFQMGGIYLRQGRYAEAIVELNQAKKFSEDNAQSISSLGYAWAKAGDPAKARAALDELQSLSSGHYVAPSNFAKVYAGLGETDLAFAALERAYAERDLELTFLTTTGDFDALRVDPRFAALLKRMNLD